jgi:glycosyltransferase involved in cell wall biosynthesis
LGGVRTTIAVHPGLQPEFFRFKQIGYAELPELRSTAQRFWFEQMRLAAIVQQVGADVLISAGNFAMRKSPVPQILLSGNSLYTSHDFYRDLRDRREYWMWLDTRLRALLARQSVLWADCTVAPTQAFARELKRLTAKDVVAISHGFDCNLFFADAAPLAPHIRVALDSAAHDLKLLYVSHYNYFRNFETLLRALPLIREKLAPRKVRLFLTCKLQPGENPGSYRPQAASALLRQLQIEDEVVQLGTIPYGQLHHLYRACDLYVTSSYAETFAHPLVEARACGLRVIASDLAVHREVAGDSALYFSRFSAEDLAAKVLQGASSQEVGKHPLQPSSKQFSWREHVDQLLALAASLVEHRVAA